MKWLHPGRLDRRIYSIPVPSKPEPKLITNRLLPCHSHLIRCHIRSIRLSSIHAMQPSLMLVRYWPDHRNPVAAPPLVLVAGHIFSRIVTSIRPYRLPFHSVDFIHSGVQTVQSQKGGALATVPSFQWSVSPKYTIHWPFIPFQLNPLSRTLRWETSIKFYVVCMIRNRLWCPVQSPFYPATVAQS